MALSVDDKALVKNEGLTVCTSRHFTYGVLSSQLSLGQSL